MLIFLSKKEGILVTGETIRGIGTGIKGLITGKSAFQQEKERREKEFQRLLVPEGTTITQTTEGEVFTRGGGQVTETELPPKTQLPVSVPISDLPRESIMKATEGGILVRTGTDIPSGIELPSKEGEPPRIFLGLTPAEITQIQEAEGIDLPIITEGTPISKAKEAIEEAPEEFGLLPAGTEIPEVEGIEVTGNIVTTGEYSPREKRLIEKWRKQLTPSMVDETGQPLPTLFLSDEEVLRQAGIQGSAQAKILLAGASVATGLGNIGKVGRGWKIGKDLFTNSKKAVQIGTSVKNTAQVATLLSKMKSIGATILAVYGGVKLIGLPFDILNRKVDEQQQAINTLGQITSTIVGDSKTGRGDFSKGLAELRHIKQALLNVESEIKQGSLKEAQLKFSGATYDIDADIYDQLATIDEGIRDLQSFAITGRFPELTDFEIQTLIRELEADGILEPVDLTTSRRQISQLKS